MDWYHATTSSPTVLPNARGNLPFLILLYGSDGLLADNAVTGAITGHYRDAARQLAANGYQVFLPHYFNRTGQHYAKIPEIHAKVPVWTSTIQDAIRHAAVQPGVDAQRLGLVGISLGGGLAFSTAGTPGTPPVRAIVDFFGFYPETLSSETKLPPTLIIHGDADKLVSIHYAERIEAQLKRFHTPYQKLIYSGLGHGLNAAARAESEAKAIPFLNRWLGQPIRGN